MELQLKQPPPLCLTGNVNENYKKWKQRFQIYITASGADSKGEDNVKVALFLHTIGEEAYQIYNTFEFAREPTYKEVVNSFDNYFDRIKYEAKCRNKFFTRKMKENETFDEFVSSLRTLSADCNFDKLKDSLIRDQIVLGIRNRQFVDRLLDEENLDLNKCINIYKRLEMAAELRKELASEESLENVNAVQINEEEKDEAYIKSEKTYDVNTDDVSTTAVLNAEECSEDEANEGDGSREEIIQSSVQDIVTYLRCRTVRIGSYRYTPKEKVHISSKGIKIMAPSLKNAFRDVALEIELKEVVRILVHYGIGLPVIFLYTRFKCGAYIREALEMSEGSGLHFDPMSKHDPYKRIILFPDEISEEAKVLIQSLFGKQLDELSSREANQILIRVCPKENTPVTKMKISSASATITSGTKCSNPVEMRHILINSPDKGGIPIYTEANTSPAHDHGGGDLSGGQSTSQAWCDINKPSSSRPPFLHEEEKDKAYIIIESDNTDVHADDVITGDVKTEQCFEECADEGEEPEPHLESPHLNDTSGVPALEKVLKGSLVASVLLNYKGSKLNGDSSRNLLTSEIAKEILRLNQNKDVIRCETYHRWANAIQSLFPGESTTTYYVPACAMANGTVLQARGKLLYQVMNLRRRLQKLGALTKKKRKISTETSCRARPAPSLLKNVEEAPTVDEDLNWLRNCSHPWSLVLVKWKNTTKERMRRLHEDNLQLAQTIESYFQEYPALKKPQGYTLLINDFEQAYGEYKDNLFINFPIVKKLLCEILTKRKKDKDALCAEVLELAQSGAEEDINLAGFLAIAHLLSFSAAISSQKKKRFKTDKTNCWKPSKIDAQNAFIKHVKADIEINDAIESQYENFMKRGGSSQPFIIIVGETLNNIERYFVIANRNVLYERCNILQTVDTCYKIFWALNALYSIESYPIWLFIQKGMYRMTSKFDKSSTSVDSLLTDCNLNL